MGDAVDLTYATAEELLALLAAKRLSARELLQASVKRCDAVHTKINAVAVRDLERAERDAKAIDEVRASGDVALGPLAGLPMTVKEAFDIPGHPATVGVPSFKDRNRNCEDSVMTRRVRGAGGIVWGKTNNPYMLADIQTYNSIYGTTNNPYDVTRTPGGSSGGSAAALASGITALEIGSDIGGSLRHPANFCGLFTLKPTWNLLPMQGHVPPLPEEYIDVDLGVVGPMARSARDLRLLFRVLSNRKADQPRKPPSAKGKRIALWNEEPHFPLSREVKAAVETAAKAFEKAGSKVERVAPPIPAKELMDTYLAILRPIVVPGYRLDPEAPPRRELHKKAVAKFFENWDAILMPVTPTPAFLHDHSEPIPKRIHKIDGKEVEYFSFLTWIALATSCHLPAAVAPATQTKEGLPIGVQLVGAEGNDEAMIDLAEVLEGELGGFRPPPP
jgi:amidase